MSRRTFTPKELDDLKREARRLGKRDGLPHVAALNQIANTMGFKDWHELQHLSRIATEALPPTETVVKRTLEWQFEVGSPDPTFARENRTVLCLDGVPIGKICRHRDLFYPVTVTGTTAGEMLQTLEEARTALEGHATGAQSLASPARAVRVQI